MQLRIRTPLKTEVAVFGRLARGVIRTTAGYTGDAARFEAAEYTSSGIVEKLRNRSEILLLAEDRGSPIGFAHGRMDCGTCWLNWIGVVRNARGRGIARKLLATIEERAVAKGAHKVWLDTKTSNRGAIAFFKLGGYRRVAHLKNHWYHGDFYIWEKKLA